MLEKERREEKARKVCGISEDKRKISGRKGRSTISNAAWDVRQGEDPLKVVVSDLDVSK